jgi:AraC-like DNA-binding protein
VGPVRETEPPLTRFDVRSQDPEYAHEVLRQTFVDFAVRPAGVPEDFAFSQVGVATPEFSHARVCYRMSAALRSGSEPGPVIVEILWDGRMKVDAGREVFSPPYGVPVLFPTEVPYAHYEVSDVDVDALVLDRPVLDRMTACLFGMDPCELSFDARTPVSPAAGSYFGRTLEHVESMVLDDDEIAAAPLVMSEATRSLAAAVLLSFPNSGLRRMEECQGQGWAEPAVLRRALDYIDEHAGEDIGADDIAAAARIGVRGLQILFRRHRNRTPMQELRRARLARAHADLQVADPSRGDSVGGIATRWGFPGAGQLAVQYLPAFGCRPEETLLG